MAKFTPLSDEDFNSGNSKYFSKGVHKVIIDGARVGKSEVKGTPYITFYVKSEDGSKEDETERQYVTENTVLYILKTLSAIAVHNREGEEAKQKARDYFKTIDDTDVVASDEFLAGFEGMQAWISRYEDESSPKPNGGYYLRNRLWGFEPNFGEKKEEKATETTIQEDIKGGESIDLSQIPF